MKFHLQRLLYQSVYPSPMYVVVDCSFVQCTCSTFRICFCMYPTQVFYFTAPKIFIYLFYGMGFYVSKEEFFRTWNKCNWMPLAFFVLCYIPYMCHSNMTKRYRYRVTSCIDNLIISLNSILSILRFNLKYWDWMQKKVLGCKYLVQTPRRMRTLSTWI